MLPEPEMAPLSGPLVATVALPLPEIATLALPATTPFASALPEPLIATARSPARPVAVKLPEPWTASATDDPPIPSTLTFPLPDNAADSSDGTVTTMRGALRVRWEPRDSSRASAYLAISRARG